jgi:outer membrane protein OmpA-like peptidoglycan-associated protein
VLLGATLCVVGGAAVRAQPAATLEQYEPAPRPQDGFALSSGETGPHLHLAAQLHIDYARNPLLYERVAGQASSRVALVSDQVTSHAALSLGLFGFALLYVALPVDLWMHGNVLGPQPTATGFGAGDLLLGGRLAIHHSKHASVAFQLGVTAPTAESGAHGRPGVAGDSGVTVHPELVSELASGPLSVLVDVGARWRQDAHFAGTRFTDVLTFGAGVSWALSQRLLRAIFELHGQTPMDDVGNREGSPLEALLGAKLAPGAGFSIGLAGGAGLLRGYGSPVARVIAMFGYSSARDAHEREPAEQEPVETEPSPVSAEPSTASAEAPTPVVAPPDRDQDAIEDSDDRCPIAPGPADNQGCPRFLHYDEQSGEITLERRVHFVGDAKQPRAVGDDGLDELLAFMRANPEIHLRIEAHLSHSADARKAQQVSVLRAAAVAHLLIEQGVPEPRLEAFGCGQTRPIVPERGSQRAKNERVVAYVIRPLPEAGLRSSLGCTQAELAPEPAPTVLKEPALPAPEAPPKKPEPKVAPQPAPVPVPLPKPAPVQPAPAPAAPLVLVAPASDSVRIDLVAGRIELQKPIRFEEGSPELKPISLGYLNEIAATLRANPKLTISIEVYVATEAGTQASLALTQQRAKNVHKRLAAQGIAPERMKAYGCGESRPIAPNNVPWGRKKNDRVELHVLDPAPSTGVHSMEGCIASE